MEILSLGFVVGYTEGARKILQEQLRFSESQSQDSVSLLGQVLNY